MAGDELPELVVVGAAVDAAVAPQDAGVPPEVRRPLLLKGGGVREGRLQVQAWLINEHNRRFNIIIIIIIIIIGVAVVAAVRILIIMMTAGDAEDAS